jgi:hypothetical protein
VEILPEVQRREKGTFQRFSGDLGHPLAAWPDGDLTDSRLAAAVSLTDDQAADCPRWTS